MGEKLVRKYRERMLLKSAIDEYLEESYKEI